MDKKTAVYVCRGCDIGDSLDLEALGEVAADEFSPEFVRDQECLWRPFYEKCVSLIASDRVLLDEAYGM